MIDESNEIEPLGSGNPPEDADRIPTELASSEDEAPAKPADPAVFEAEMNPHLDSLYRNAMRLTGNSNDAEDLVQDTYLRAYRFFHQYQPGTNAKAWLFRIMNTVFLNDYRKKSRQGDQLSYDELEDFYLYNKLSEEALSKEQSYNMANPEDVIVERLGIEEIEDAIRKLPGEFRETVALATMEDLSYQEISDVLHIPIGTVRSRLSRGRKLLQRALWQVLGKTDPDALGNGDD
ncbi:MAG: sigma-70 family RNA polymerase sigma factor [Capsulimonadaceae bacterium]|nr:sigma-70 family RNA polymerase sigma factor [Capsulimonadaceae bacterium]